MRHTSSYDVCVPKTWQAGHMARHMRKITVSDFFGSGVFQLVGKHSNPSNTANSLQATRSLNAV